MLSRAPIFFLLETIIAISTKRAEWLISIFSMETGRHLPSRWSQYTPKGGLQMPPTSCFFISVCLILFEPQRVYCQPLASSDHSCNGSAALTKAHWTEIFAAMASLKHSPMIPPNCQGVQKHLWNTLTLRYRESTKNAI